jgi:hypothetical protein
MTERSPLHALVAITRNFGLIITMRVIYSKIRGLLVPALALPRASPHVATQRELSVLLSTLEQSAATLNTTIEAIVGHRSSNWELCICERTPTTPEMARVLDRWRGTQPWIRIITSNERINLATAAQWTVEQASGEFVALVAANYSANADVIEKLLTYLRNDTEIGVALIVSADNACDASSPLAMAAECRLLVQKKAAYLAAFPQQLQLGASAVASMLHEAGVASLHIVDTT